MEMQRVTVWVMMHQTAQEKKSVIRTQMTEQSQHSAKKWYASYGLYYEAI